MSETTILVLLVVSRLPLYGYAAYKAWAYRRSIVVISTLWLGLIVFASMAIGVSNAFASDFITGLGSYLLAFSVFMLAYTAKPVKEVRKSAVL